MVRLNHFIVAMLMFAAAAAIAAPPGGVPADGTLSFDIIRNGIRFTGMPGFATVPVEEDAETWGLVHFIRRLPQLSEQDLAEMKNHNPVSRKQLEEEDEIRRFLAGDDVR